MFALDMMAARQRHEQMLREAEEIRLARRIADSNGTATLLSRMVKLLSRSSQPAQNPVRMEGPLNQHPLADANSR